MRIYREGEEVSGLPLFATLDHLGSVRELSDGEGALRARYDYDANGRRSDNLIVVNPKESSLGFTGHQVFLALDLIGATYRFYQPSLGRWLSRDPIEEDGGINLYEYVDGNPGNLTDPLGLVWGMDFIDDPAYDATLQAISDFSAGWGDSLSFGLTERIREWNGTNGYVDKCSEAYDAGEKAQMALDLLTLGAGAGLKFAARGVVTKAVRMEKGSLKAYREMAKTGTPHHRYPLAGAALFPTKGLGGKIANGAWNLAKVAKGEGGAMSFGHAARHATFRAAEVALGVSSSAVTGRAYNYFAY